MLASAGPAKPVLEPSMRMDMPVATAPAPTAVTTMSASTAPATHAMFNTAIHRWSVASSSSTAAPPSPPPQLHLSLLGLAPCPQSSPKMSTNAVASPTSCPSNGVPTTPTTYAPVAAPGTAPAPANVLHLLAQQVAARATARSACIAASILLSQLTCPVCGEVLDQPVTLPCGHSACAMCLVPPSSCFRPIHPDGPDHASHNTPKPFHLPPHHHEAVSSHEVEGSSSSGYCATSSSSLTSSGASSQSYESATPEEGNFTVSPAGFPTLRPSPPPARRRHMRASSTLSSLGPRPQYKRPSYRTKRAVLHARRGWIPPLVPLNTSTVACPVTDCPRSLVGQGVGTWAGRSLAYIPPSQQAHLPTQQWPQAEPEPDSGFWLGRADAALDLRLVGPIPSRGRISRPRVHSAPPKRTRSTSLPQHPIQITGFDSDSSLSPSALHALLDPPQSEGVRRTEPTKSGAASAPESSASSNTDGMSPYSRTLESTWWYDPLSEHHIAASPPSIPSWHDPSQVGTQAFQVDMVLSQLIDTLRAVTNPARTMADSPASQRSSTTTLIPSPPPSDANDPAPVDDHHAPGHPRNESPASPPAKRARLVPPGSPPMDNNGFHLDLPAAPTTLSGLKQAMLDLLRCSVRSTVLRDPICLPCGHTICRTSVVDEDAKPTEPNVDTSLLCSCCSIPVSHSWIASHPSTQALMTMITSDFEVPLSEVQPKAAVQQPAVPPIRPQLLRHGSDPAWSSTDQIVSPELERRSRSNTLHMGSGQRTMTDRTTLTTAAQAAMFDAAGGQGTLGAQLLSESLTRTPSRFNLQT